MEVEDPKEWRKRTAREIMAQYPWLLQAYVDGLDVADRGALLWNLGYCDCGVPRAGHDLRECRLDGI